MAIEEARIPIAENDSLTIKNGEAWIDVVHLVYNEDGTDFDFPAYVSSYMKVYQSKDINAKKIKEFTTQITRNSNAQVFNLSEADITFTSNGTFWYEIGYLRSGGYEQALREGDLIVER